jgi:hypothetical protein
VRPDHTSSGRLEKSFEPDTEFQVVLKAIQEGQLIDKDRPPSAKRWVATKPQVGNLSMPIKDAFEVFIKIFHRDGTEFVKEASDFHAIIGVGIASILCGHQQPIRLVTVLVQVRGVVMEISQDETYIGGNFAQQSRSRLTIGDIGRSQHRRDGKPDGCHDGDDVQFPAIDESHASRI